MYLHIYHIYIYTHTCYVNPKPTPHQPLRPLKGTLALSWWPPREEPWAVQSAATGSRGLGQSDHRLGIYIDVLYTCIVEHICGYIHVYVCIFEFTCVYIHIELHLYIYSVYIYKYIYIYMYAMSRKMHYVCIYIHACMYIHVYMYIYMYMH